MVIYKIINKINGKIYIGKNCTDNDDYFGSGITISKSIKKYGIENFEKTIIDTASSIEDLNNKEIYWISYYNSTDRTIGYNIAKGGNGGNTRLGYSEEEQNEYRKKLSEGLKNSESYKKSVENKRNKMRPEHSIKMKSLYKEGKIKIWNKGVETSDEVKQKISEKNKGKKRNNDTKLKMAKSKWKPIQQMDYNNNVINEFLSIDEASKKCNINRCGISDVCNGRQKTSGGFKWRFK